MHKYQDYEAYRLTVIRLGLLLHAYARCSDAPPRLHARRHEGAGRRRRGAVDDPGARRGEASRGCRSHPSRRREAQPLPVGHKGVKV